jgi:hypothetical protein
MIKVLHNSIGRMIFVAMMGFIVKLFLRGEQMDIPSSNTRSAKFCIFTNPCVKASKRILCVDTTTCTLVRESRVPDTALTPTVYVI